MYAIDSNMILKLGWILYKDNIEERTLEYQHWSGNGHIS